MTETPRVKVAWTVTYACLTVITWCVMTLCVTQMVDAVGVVAMLLAAIWVSHSNRVDDPDAPVR